MPSALARGQRKRGLIGPALDETLVVTPVSATPIRVLNRMREGVIASRRQLDRFAADFRR